MGVLRPPIDAENDGRLYAISASPDGQYVAVGGWTGLSWTGAHGIYVYHRESAKLIRRIGEFPNVVLAVAYSRDGRYMAAGLARGAGVAVFSTDQWRLIGKDSGFGSDVYALDWGNDGLLIAGGLDGRLRSFKVGAQALNHLQSFQAPASLGIRGLRVSPDGRTIGVTYVGQPAVDLLQADSLAVQASLPMAGIARGGMAHLVWSQDSRFLFAAGSAPVIRRWEVATRTTNDTAVFGGPVTALGMAKSSLIVATAQPAVGTLSLDGKPVWQRSANTWPFVSGPAIASSMNGLAVEIQVEPPPGVSGRARKVLRIDLGSREFGVSNVEALPQTTSSPLLVDLQAESAPLWNGKRLALRDLERSRTGAVTPDGRFALIGSDWGVQAFDRAGRVVWRWASMAPVRGVGVSGDGRIVIAALSDGTARWIDARNGREVLAALVTRSGQKWILWTSEGHYEAGPGAETLLGWHFNTGIAKNSDFVPAAQLRKTMAVPDLVAVALSSVAIRPAGDTNEPIPNSLASDSSVPETSTAVTEAKLPAARLPPVIETLQSRIPAPPVGATARIAYLVRVPSEAPVTGMRVRINGLPSDATFEKSTGTPPDAPSVSGIAVVPVPTSDEGELLLELFAENANGVSAPAVVRVGSPNDAEKTKASAEIRPKLYMLVVGVGNYVNADLALEYPAKDAADFASAMTSQKGRLYRDAEVRLLRDREASRDAVLGGLEWLKRAVTSRDVGILFMAGHGVNDETGNYYFLPADFVLEEYKRTAVPFTEIKDTLANLAGKALFFIDTCHSGNILGGGRRAVGTSHVTRVANELSSAENGVVVFSSSTGRQVSLEHKRWGNGAFTKALVEGLQGKADMNRSGRVTHRMLDVYISERVKELTQGKQTPVSQAPGGVPDFPVALSDQSTPAIKKN
jgi:hypothetical protein